MSAFGQQLKTLLLIVALVALTGIAILLVLIFSEEVGVLQIALIALILLLWPVGFLVRYFLKNRQPAPVAADDGANGASAPRPQTGSLAPSRSYDELARGAEETVQWLRSSKLGAASGDAAYGLPWFVVAGPQGSGKTSLLLSSGLSFNALPSQRRADQNLLRATRDAEWRVTDNCVLIDTAGRYQTEGPDRDEWLGLIEALKKHRRARPLDGLVLAVDATRLLASNDAELEQQAGIMRARLDDLTKSTGARFPVYLVFTQADAIPGFAEFFRTLPPHERAGVWGATMPLSQAQVAHGLVDKEFALLLDALHQRRLLRLSSAGAAAEQLGVFGFPLRFGEAGPKFARFALALFRPNPFSEAPLFRGFYFTSSAAAGGASAAGADAANGEARVTSKGAFAEDFFGKVLLPDKDLAASFQAGRETPGRLRKIMAAALAFAALCLLWVGGMLVSYFNNRDLIARGREHGESVLRHYEAGKGQREVKTTDAELADLDKLREVIEELDANGDSFFGSLGHRFGLYSGHRVNERLHQVYFDFVSQRFLAPALVSLERELGTTTPPASSDAAAEDALDNYFYKLQAYLMLERQERMDAAFLETQLAAHWDEPASVRGRKEALSFFAAEAARHGDEDLTVPRPKPDDAVTSDARAKLKSYSVNKRTYNEVVRSINKLGEPTNLPKILDSQANSELLEEQNPHPVAYAFTKAAYYKYITGDALLDIVSKSGSRDDWVIGGKAGSQNVDLKWLQTQYSRDYATHWEKFLKGVRVGEFKDKDSAVEALEKLSQPNSPLETVIRAVASQTKLSEPPTESGLIGWLKGLVASKTKITDTGVEKNFEPIIKISGSEQMRAYLKALKEVSEKLSLVRGNDWKDVAPALQNDKEFQKAAGDVSSMLRSLKTTTASAAAAELLERPVTNIGGGLKKGLSSNEAEAWSALVQKARALEQRYPFNPTSAAQVLIPELAQFLNPANGTLTDFYNKFLAQSFDGAPGQLRPREANAFPQASVDYLNNAFKLRDALFPPGSQQPTFVYSITVQTAPGGKAEVTINGAKIGGTATPSWPGAGDSGAGIIVRSLQSEPPTELKKYDGPWGLFRMAREATKVGPMYQIKWGAEAQASLQAPSNDPFAFDFSRLRAPDKLR
jgi:type VI secretion system protein ImpL